MVDRRSLIVSVSGIRGIIGEGLTPAVAANFGSALGTYLQGGKVLLCRDGRPSGLMLRHAVLAGLLATGCEVKDLGVAPTPTVGLAVRRLQANGAIQITASHNPAPWNGLKLFGDDGRVLSAARGKEVQTIFETGTSQFAAFDQLGHWQDRPQATRWHLDRVLELVDVVRIRSRQLKVLLDANGGAGGPLGHDLLDALQCQPTVIGGNADGFFEHEPEPVEENLRTVGPRIVEANADIGFVLDPDADRLALIDETGRYIGEELTLALAVWFRLQQQRGPVVMNMSTSRIVEDICRKYEVPCYRSAVGEANVVDRMLETGAVIGGEGNGGVIDPRVGWVRDPFIGMGLILNLLADTKKKLSQLVAELPQYHIVKSKCQIDRNELPELFAQVEKTWPDARITHEDGQRLDWPDRWLHIRPSNTEPIVRIIAEAPTDELAQQLVSAVLFVRSKLAVGRTK